MQRLKKAFLFILGLYIVPVFLGDVCAFIFGYSYFKDFAGYFVVVYFLVYFIFPFLYRGKIREKIPNRYLFYAMLYLLFSVLLVFICIIDLFCNSL